MSAKPAHQPEEDRLVAKVGGKEYIVRSDGRQTRVDVGKPGDPISFILNALSRWLTGGK
jgi:hypothetical protein